MSDAKDTATIAQEEALAIERDVSAAVRLLELVTEHVGHRAVTVTHTVRTVNGNLEETRTTTIEVKE